MSWRALAKNHTASAQNERREDDEDRETSIDHLVFTLNSSGSHITEACHQSERLHVRARPKDTGRTTQPTLISHEVHCPAPTFFHVVRVQRPCVQFTHTSFLKSMTFRRKPPLSLLLTFSPAFAGGRPTSLFFHREKFFAPPASQLAAIRPHSQKRLSYAIEPPFNYSFEVPPYLHFHLEIS